MDTSEKLETPSPSVTPAEVRTAPPSPPDMEPKVSPTRWRRVWALGGVIAIAVAAFLLWRMYFSPVTVSVAPVQSNVQEQVFGLGQVGARVQSNLGFKVAGVISQLNADQGDRVHAGQVLARLDARDIEAQVALAKANVIQARANVVKAQADVASAEVTLANDTRINQRYAGLVPSGSIAKETAENAETAMHVASANVQVAQSEAALDEAAVQSAEAQQRFEEATLAQYTLTAPYDGWVISRNLELGASFNPGNSSQSVFTLVEANSVWIVSYVDETLAGRLQVGEPADIVLRSDPTERFPSHIARIEIQSDAVNEERVVDVAFDHLPDNIHLAEQAEVFITTGHLKQAVLVPQAAVMDFAQGKGTVWTLERGKIAKRSVTFGPQLLDGRLPVLSGLPEGAAVVLPQSGLRVGRAAKVTSEPKK
jgi:HlyD family secretion protein